MKFLKIVLATMALVLSSSADATLEIIKKVFSSMKNFIRSPLTAGLLVMSAFAPCVSQASLIVDTGEGVGSQPLLNHQQWLAAEFSVSQSYNITEVSGWIRTVVEGDVTFSLYDDGGNLPGTLLFSSTITLGLSDPQWETISGLNWEIDSGDYWIAFTSSDELYRGTMQGQSPNQLGHEAHTGVIPDVWFDSNDDAMGLGVMIQADLAPVPVPAAVWLFGSGLIGLVGLARKQANA